MEKNSFIKHWYLEDLTICDELIAFHKMSPHKVKGTAGLGVDESKKKSTDVYILPQKVSNIEIAKKYFLELRLIAQKYQEIYEHSNADKNGPFGLTEPMSIQHYQPSEGYFMWHAERSGAKPPYTLRHLVYMTYLNDVTDGGETEFLYQNEKFQPRKGMTLIWPADWTHTHRGITSKTQEKFIITGWLNFY